MITRELAVELGPSRTAWRPASGDRFLVPDRDLDDEVFVVSGMSIEVSDLPSGTEMRFNGTVEWALDSIAQAEVIWLPREDQMRDVLGDAVPAAGVGDRRLRGGADGAGRSGTSTSTPSGPTPGRCCPCCPTPESAVWTRWPQTFA